MTDVKSDEVNLPAHYLKSKATITVEFEPIELTALYDFCTGNAIKYLLRAPFKDKDIDYKKALFYLDKMAEDLGVYGIYVAKKSNNYDLIIRAFRVSHNLIDSLIVNQSGEINYESVLSTAKQVKALLKTNQIDSQN